MQTRTSDHALPAAIGSTVASKPIVRQALERVRAGTLAPTDFRLLYQGEVDAAKQEAEGKHLETHGFDPNQARTKLLRTLGEVKR